MTEKSLFSSHGIKDNHTRGKVADFLEAKLVKGSRFSMVSAYFTIYAYEAFRKELDGIESLQFLFGEPRFIQSLDPAKTDKKAFKIEDEGLTLANRLHQKEVARRCAEWIKCKVEIRSIRQTNLLHAKLHHIDDVPLNTNQSLAHTSCTNVAINFIVNQQLGYRPLPRPTPPCSPTSGSASGRPRRGPCWRSMRS